jgi:serine/threonine protein kinase
MPTGPEPGNAEGSDPARPVNDTETVVHRPDADSAATPATSGAGIESAGVAALDEFSRALIEIGLIDAAELDAFAADSAEGVLGLSRALVKAGKLTPYQAAAVYQKKSRGLLIGNYLILVKLGQGDIGVVFKARHRLLGRVGALKILPPSFARDRDAVLRFRREVEAASRLKHPNLVAAQDVDEDRGVHFLVMDYVEGCDLDRIVRERGPMQVSQAVDCLIQAARGLEAAHAQGIIHRDIKPRNLVLDSTGTVRVLDLGMARIVDAGNPFSKTAAGRLTRSGMYMGTIDYMAPEQAEDSHRVDHRADIYSLGCTLYYLLTGKEPFPAETVLKRLLAHMERPAPSLVTARPGVSRALEAAYQKMMAKRPDDRPASMAEVIALLEASKVTAAEVRDLGVAAPASPPEPMVFDEPTLKRAAPPKTKAEPSIFARREEREGFLIDHELNLEDLVMNVRTEAPPPVPPATKPASRTSQPLKRSATTRSRGRRNRPSLVLSALAAIVAASAVFVRFALFSGTVPKSDTQRSRPALVGDSGRTPPSGSPPSEATTLAATVPDPGKLIFDGTSGQGWMLCDHKPVPSKSIQPDGLNPHGTGSYLVVYEQKIGDFVLDFDYKLTKGCNSGVFLRVSDLKNPIYTGIEVAIDDIRRGDERDSGGFYGLVAPTVFAQKPASEWNHMTITAAGPLLAVSLNGTEVSNIHLDLWTVPGKRPDGTDHKFKNLAVAKLARSGYLGFQDLGGNCWFKNVVLRKPSSTAIPSPGDAVGSPRPHETNSRFSRLPSLRAAAGKTPSSAMPATPGR